MKKSLPDFFNQKQNKEKICMITAYDYPSALMAEKAEVDIILVGDSMGNVVLGYDSTVPVTVDDILLHTKAARRGAPNTFIVADMPFMSYATEEMALLNAGRLIKEGGADCVKLEGGTYFAKTVELLTQNGIPVIGHIGLTPQTATQLGGLKVQGRTLESAQKLMEDGKAIEEAGAFMIVLEAIPRQLGEEISRILNIPTIGIGAGVECDGQVLVYHDLLGFYDRFKPKFVKQYANLGEIGQKAIREYCTEVREGKFPLNEHTFSLSDEVIEKLYGNK